VVATKFYIFGDIAPCSPVKFNRSFGEILRLHLQGLRVRQARNQQEGGRKQRKKRAGNHRIIYSGTNLQISCDFSRTAYPAFCLFHAGLLLSLLSDPGAGIATGCMARVRFPAVQDFSLLHSIQTDSGAHPASYQWVSGALSPAIMRPGCEADHSPRSSAEVKNGGAIPPLPHACSWLGASLMKPRDNFNSYLLHGVTSS
jgi:hypothetical protein